MVHFPDNHLLPRQSLPRQLLPSNYFEVIFFVLGKITLVGNFRRFDK